MMHETNALGCERGIFAVVVASHDVQVWCGVLPKWLVPLLLERSVTGTYVYMCSKEENTATVPDNDVFVLLLAHE